MKLTVKAPDGQSYVPTGKLHTVTVKNGPAGIYTIIVGGVSGLGTQGEEPFVAVASAESCVSADIAQNHAVHRGYTAHDLILALNQSGGVPGLSNLTLTISETLSPARSSPARAPTTDSAGAARSCWSRTTVSSRSCRPAEQCSA